MFWVRIDDRPPIQRTGIVPSGTGKRKNIRDDEDNHRSIEFDLSAGKRTLGIAYREDDTILDQVVLPKR